MPTHFIRKTAGCVTTITPMRISWARAAETAAV
jgi:hypothetical protein